MIVILAAIAGIFSAIEGLREALKRYRQQERFGTFFAPGLLIARYDLNLCRVAGPSSLQALQLPDPAEPWHPVWIYHLDGDAFILHHEPEQYRETARFMQEWAGPGVAIQVEPQPDGGTGFEGPQLPPEVPQEFAVRNLPQPWPTYLDGNRALPSDVTFLAEADPQERRFSLPGLIWVVIFFAMGVGSALFVFDPEHSLLARIGLLLMGLLFIYMSGMFGWQLGLEAMERWTRQFTRSRFGLFLTQDLFALRRDARRLLVARVRSIDRIVLQANPVAPDSWEAVFHFQHQLPFHIGRQMSGLVLRIESRFCANLERISDVPALREKILDRR